MADKFIFITEDNEVFFTDEPPTKHDMYVVKSGMLHIIRCSDMRELDQELAWVPVTKGILKHLDEDDELGPYHGVP